MPKWVCEECVPYADNIAQAKPCYFGTDSPVHPRSVPELCPFKCPEPFWVPVEEKRNLIKTITLFLFKRKN